MPHGAIDGSRVAGISFGHPSTGLPNFIEFTFVLRKPHLEWLNDNGSIYFALEGPAYLVNDAQFQVASATIETIAANTDIDGDGDTDGDDLAGLVGDYGCSGTCAADLDGDGIVDESDVYDFSRKTGSNQTGFMIINALGPK